MVTLEARVRLREGAEISITDAGTVHLRASVFSYSFDSFSSGTIAALQQMAERFVVEDELDDLVIANDGDFGVIGWKKTLAMFVRAGFLEREYASDQRVLFRMIPDALPMVADGIDVYPSTVVSLSRFAVARVVDRTIEIESPRSGWRIVCEDPSAVAFLSVIATPRLLSTQLQEAGKIGLSADGAAAFVSALASAGMVVAHDSEEASSPEDRDTLAQWSTADLLFHERSRVGRTQRPFGGTYPFQDSAVLPTPFVREAAETSIELAVPSDSLDSSAAAFFDVLESRRSVREFDDENPITKNELSELLWRTVRVRKLYEDNYGGVVDRPYPSGGAVHELDVHVAVRLVAGLDPGLYRYNPIENVLVPVAGDSPEFRMWMSAVPPWPQIDSLPQATLVISARFGRAMWKYQSMAYALILKNAGVLLQTLYLAVTALNLGGCALGAGDSERFSSLAGLDPYEESSVSEFAIGRPAAELTPSFTIEFGATTIRTDGGEVSHD